VSPIPVGGRLGQAAGVIDSPASTRETTAMNWLRRTWHFIIDRPLV
jgi:hypothetical protein